MWNFRWSGTRIFQPTRFQWQPTLSTHDPNPPITLNNPDAPVGTDRSAFVFWSELEIPTAARSARLFWSELEIPLAPRSARVFWSEIETPLAPRSARVFWSELEAPLA